MNGADGRRKLFIAHRIAHPTVSAKEAAIAAGFSPKSAAQRASELLADPQIADAIRRGVAKVAQRAELSLETHLSTLARLRNKAAAAEQFGPAVNAEVHRGKAAGLYVERHRVEIERVKALSDEEIERLAADMGLA
jgi:phage terminase small subunit